MVQADSQIAAIGHVIQLAVAPVFLLTGVGALLSVLTNRLARIIDRARVLEERLPAAGEPAQAGVHRELSALSRRARHINRAVSLCTTCALFICAVIVTLFIGAFLSSDVTVLIGLLFIGAMLALFIALLSFLREIHIATQHLRIGPH